MMRAAFVKKETLHVLRDWRMLLVVVLIPVVQMLLFGFAISTEVNNVDVAVTWQKYSEDVRQHIQRLESNPYITLIGRVDPEEVYPLLRRGGANAVVWFRDGEEAQVITDASNPVNSQSSAGYVTAILTGAHGNPMVDTHYLYNPLLKSAYNFAPGIMGMLFLLVCALMTAVAIVREKETGTLDLLLVSPAHPSMIITSKMVPFFVLSCIDLLLILLIARFMLDVPLSGGVLSITLLTLLYIVLSLAFGLLVSTIAKNQVMAMLICGMVMIMPVVMLSGLMFPLDNLPIILKQFSAIVPARWYIDAMRKLMIEGLSLADVWLDAVILLFMTALIMVVAIRNFKDRTR